MSVDLDQPSQLPSLTADAAARPWWRTVLWWYVLGRVAVLAGIAGAVALRHRPLSFALHRWDARWYVWVAQHGYPRSTRTSVFDYQSPHSFFPMFPLLVRAVSPVFAGSLLAAALTLNLVLGAVLVLAARAVFAEVVAPQLATRAAVLVATFPGAFVLSLAYSEALALAAGALALLALLRRRWLLAGLAGAVATATRPNMVAVVAAGVVAVLLHLRTHRRWADLPRPLLAPVLSCAGVLGYICYLRVHTGVWDAWQRAEARFGQHRDFLASFVHRLPRELGHAFTGNHANYTVYLGSLVALAVLAVLAVRARLHPVLATYVLVLVALTVSYSAVNARPRFLLAMFPLLLGLARPLGSRLTVAFASAGLLGIMLTTYLYLGASHVIP